MALDTVNISLIDGLIIKKTAVPSVCYVGNPIYYIITIKNITNEAISNITLIDNYSNTALVTLCQASNNEASYTNNTVTWNIKDLPSLAEEKLNILLIPNEEGVLKNTIEAFLSDISKGCTDMYSTVLDLNSQLSSLEDKLSSIENSLASLSTKQEINLSNIEGEILGNIPSLVSAINEKVDMILQKNTTSFTTGPIIKDVNAKSLIIFLSNNTPKDATVKILVKSPHSKAENEKFIDVLVKGGSYYLSILPCPPVLFEVVYLDIVKGINIFTATRRNIIQDPYQSSILIPSNTILNKDLTPL